MASAAPDVLSEEFGAERVDEGVAPSWNVAPGALLHAVAGTRSGRRLGTMRWGLIPASGPIERAPRPINARAETLTERPLFAGALARRRCLLPVEGFYEWQRTGEGRRPHFIAAADGAHLALAGIWDRWSPAGGDPLVTCAIVTTRAGPDVAHIHDRVPVVVPRSEWNRWLDPRVCEPALLRHLLVAPPAGTLTVRPVSRRVNSAANDGADLVAPAGDEA